MEEKTSTKGDDFIKGQILGLENRLFWSTILLSSIGYLIITLWLNSIRATAPIGFVWILIIIQFTLYFSIFVASIQRSIVFGLNNSISFILFTILAILGRVNDWELVIIPLLVVIMLILSVKNKKVSKKRQFILIKK